MMDVDEEVCMVIKSLLVTNQPNNVVIHFLIVFVCVSVGL
jgi:hypothetical protein